MKLYFIQWSELLRLKCAEKFKKQFKSGYWNGYRACFEKHLGIDWSESPASLPILEEVAMARNSIQHLQSLPSLQARHAKNLRSKFPNPLFVHDFARNVSEEQRVGLLEHWFGPELIVNQESLFEAIEEAESFVAWLEPKLQRARWG